MAKQSDQTETVQTGQNTGRDAKGRFAAGNGFARNGKGGRPKRSGDFAAKVSEIVSRNSDWDKIVKRAVADAIGGCPRAREWLSDRLMGKPKTYLEASVTTWTENAFMELLVIVEKYVADDDRPAYEEELFALSDRMEL